MLSNKDRETIDDCALRFDGFAYAMHRGAPDGLAALSDRVVETLRLWADPNENLAAFFALQRYLGKWGGERLAESSREWIAFKFLYLHLYRVEVPREFRLAEDFDRWRRRPRGRAEQVAARLRIDLASPRPAGSAILAPEG